MVLGGDLTHKHNVGVTSTPLHCSCEMIPKSILKSYLEKRKKSVLLSQLCFSMCHLVMAVVSLFYHADYLYIPDFIRFSP